MKKHLVALAAMTLVTLGAYAVGSSGDIVSIDAVPVNEQGIEYPNMSSPHQVGESFYILVRLQNENWDDVDPHPWVLERSSDHAAASKTEAYAYWPALRIAIGGQKVDAEFVWTGPNGEPSGAPNQELSYYTDFYFKYTVKEGQLGLPVRLVDAKDKIIEDPTTFSDTGYKFVNVNVNTSLASSRSGKYWDIRNNLGTLLNAWFGPDYLEPPDYPTAPHNDGAHRSFDLTAEGIYVKTVDFEESYAIDSTDPKIWREVYQGGDDEAVAKDPSITGTGPTTVYLWSSDESVVKLVPWDSASSLEMVSWGGVNHQVLKLAIGGGETSGKFRLKGGSAVVGTTAKIVLCGTRTPPLLASGDLLPGATLERTIRLKEPRSPTLSLTDADGNQSFKALATNPVQAVQMKLKLSQAFSNDFQVTLTLKAGETTFDPRVARCVSLLLDDGDPTAGSITNITVKPKAADYTGEVYFNLYALGTCKEIKENNNNITITPSIDKTKYPDAWKFFEGGDHKGATVKISDQKPIVTATPASTTVFANDTVDIGVTVDDNWRDLQPTLATNGYKVVVQLGNIKIETNGVHFTEGASIPFTITVPSVSDAATVYCNVQVTDPVGNVSAKYTTSIEVQPPLTADIRTFSSTSLSVEPDADPTYVEGQENVYVRAVLSSASNAKLYAFVVPMDAVSSNLIETTAMTNGLVVSVGDTYSGYARLKLLDGNLDGRKVNLGVVLKDKQDFNDPSAQIVTTYSTEGRMWGITVTNAVPTFGKRVCWAGDETNRQYIANGGIYSGKVAATTPITFFVQVTDPGALDMADKTKPIRVQWEWTDGDEESGIGTETAITSVDSNGIAKLEIAFQTEKVQQTVTMRVQDRDMQSRNESLFADGEYTFKVNVGNVPTVIIEYPQGNGGYFYENSDNRLNYIVIKVSEWPTGSASGRQKLSTTNPLKVRVRIPDEFKPTDHGNLLFRNWNGLNADGVATNETIVTFKTATKAVNSGERIYFDRYSQNGGKDTGGSLFIVQGDVVTTTKSSDSQTWAQYYAAAEKEVTIVNVEPKLTLDLAADDTHDAWGGEGGTNEWTTGEKVKLSWTYEDIAKDVTNSWAAISWTLTDIATGKRSVKVCNATGTKTITSPAVASFTGSYSFYVPKAEYTQVLVTINDGDDGKCEYVFYIHVIPTKQIAITTYGPAESTQTKYNRYPGIGRGQVYVYGSTEQYEARSFLQTWNYAESDLQASLAAAGYPATNVVAYDDGKMGTLAGYPSGAILTQLGGKWDTSMAQANRYNYGFVDDNDDWKYDNFFYCWVQLADTEVTYLAPTPTSKPSTPSPKTFSLANEKDDDAGGYSTIQIEAIFAREYLTSDNLGDINNDGIPDLYAQLYPDLGAYNVEDGSAINDLTKIHKLNNDNDFLPGDVDLGVSKENSRYDQWKTPFTAIKEIRGWDEHLNDAPKIVSIKGAKSEQVYTDPRVDENSTLSYLEYRAWLEAGSPADWSPECPTDPTMEDTDGDGYPDGYEYYFWYRAHVGYWEKGSSDDVDTWTHKYQTGYRYNAGNPFEPYIISRETIKELFNPRVESHSTEWSTIDTDNDGIPDAEEFRLGTDPLHWDTDRDGLCDGWEVLQGLDPLDPTDALDNPDLDAMAEYETAEVSIVGLDGGEGYTEYYCLPKDEGFQFKLETNETLVAQAVAALTWTTHGITTNYYLVSKEVTIETYEHAGRTYLGKSIARTDANVGLGNTATNLVKGIATKLWAGLWIAPPPFETVNYALGTVIPPKRCYRLMQYGYWGHNDYNGIMYVRTREYNGEQVAALFAAKPPVGAPFQQTIFLQHYQVRHELGFDPRTSWKPGMTNTRPFTHFDEFMVMPFLQMEGALDADRVMPGLQRDGLTWTHEMIWAAYGTALDNADTDADGMPDGWELYTMAPAPVYDQETGFRIYNYNRDYPYAPNFINSPFAGYMDQAFLAEYCGLDSCGYYEGNCATIINIDPHWTNKQWPTDPYADDTDGDGIPDMEEKDYFYSGVATAPGMGGGLNPCSWDTDGDFLPDPWEAEFAGTYNVGATTASDTTTINPDGSTNTTHTVSGGDVTFNFDGMDGTVNDAMEDYDHDGLMNWQEYLVGAQRCWRYDDTISIWGNNEPIDGIPSDGYWCQLMLSQGYYAESGVVDYDGQHDLYNPHLLVGGMYDIGASYFSLCTNVWDSACGSYYMFKDGIYHDLATPGDKWTLPGLPPQVCNRFTWRPFIKGYVTDGMPVSDEDKGLTPWSFSFGSVEDGDHIRFPKKYICCSPIKADTDNDGMDDYYELFHGLNPLLGASAVHDNGTEPAIDLIYEAYGGGEEKNDDGSAKRVVSATCNYWLNDATSPGVSSCQRTPRSGTFNRYMDFEAYPWLTGLADADVDGDNLRNQSEAIMPDIQAASTWLHTDPSPLWLTSSDYDGSVTFRYYQVPDPNEAVTFTEVFKDGFTDTVHGVWHPWKDFPILEYDPQAATLTIKAYTLNYWNVESFFLDFEENEGYDSDHDFLSDFEETQGKTKSASDPQDTDDPLRRQAMWFPGENALLETPLEVRELDPVDSLPAGVDLPFLYYTVECWAKPEGDLMRQQTLVERALWTGQANMGDAKYLRKNFQIGINGGRWYTKYDSAGTDALSPVEITDGPNASTNWTHIAATYDGESLRLYVNGICVRQKQTGVRPEHNVRSIAMGEQGSLRRGSRSWTDQVAILVGASAADRMGLVFDWWPRYGNPFARTSFSDYDCYYKGYIDEVRVWDGARTANQILTDFRKRYTPEDAAANRQAVYLAWREGYVNRAPSNKDQLPAELKRHWTFDSLPGATKTEWVATVPGGFDTAATVTDAKAIWSRPEGWKDAWWGSVDCASTIYTDRAYIPWIIDTVGHLPRFDLTTLDSKYWSEDYAGWTNVVQTGFTSFVFPRTHETPVRWTQIQRKGNSGESHLTYDARYAMIESLEDEETHDAMLEVYAFNKRHRLREGFDLLPLGGAYPKRISSAEGGMWDDDSAADPWAQTGVDADNNGLPDWWEKYARQNYCKELSPSDPMKWDSSVTYNGVIMPAWRAYLYDLAKGMLPDGKIHPEYVDQRDLDDDGLPDWWEDMNGVQGNLKTDGDQDPDEDGLSNYAEYLLSEVYPVRYRLYEDYGVPVQSLDPLLAISDTRQRVTDYFRRYSTTRNDRIVGANGQCVFLLNEYFGEIATDHDFMEDWWENTYPNSYASAKKYDPLKDLDADGWSNWAECRASIWGGGYNAEIIDNWTGSESEQHVTDYPEPIVGVRTVYHGIQDISGKQLVIRAISGQSQRVDATFIIPSELSSQMKYIGGFLGDSKLHGHLSPGYVNPNSVAFFRAEVSSDKTYVWNCDWYKENVPNERGWDAITWSASSRTHTGTAQQYSKELSKWKKIEFEGGDLDWQWFGETRQISDSEVEVSEAGVIIGQINFITGEYWLNLDLSGTAHKDYVYRVVYTSRHGHEWPQTVYVSDTKELALGDGANIVGSGHLREGRNTIEVFMDMNGDGVYTKNEPLGVVRNVSVGWHKVPLVDVELFDDSPIMPTVALGEIASSSATETTDDQDGETIKSTTEALKKTISVYRRLINGKNENNGLHLKQRRVFTTDVVTDDHNYISAADAASLSQPDLDWDWLVRDAKLFGIPNIEKVTYSIEEVRTLPDSSITNILLATFLKEFSSTRGVATPVAPIDGAPIYASSPTFQFTASTTKATGYRLQIRYKNGSIVYDSDEKLLPANTSDEVGSSVYEVSPPIFAGMEVYAGLTNGVLFADGSNYQWRVALVNAKFNTVSEVDYSNWAEFQMDIQNSNRYPLQTTGYGNVAVAVRYFGPTNIPPSAVIVEAFANADFSGKPLAQARVVKDATDLSSDTDVSKWNAVLRGVEPGQTFFRAYFDQNNNGIRDSWESWGYANMVGMGVTAIYNPLEYTVSRSVNDWAVGSKPDVVIYMEDCDVNQNEWPDCIDEAGDFLSASHADRPYWDEPRMGTPADPLADEDGDGMPDVWEDWNKGITDPQTADGDVLPESGMDAMAYRLETRKMITIDDGSEEGLRLLLADGQTYRPRDNKLARDYVFTTWYLYGPAVNSEQIYGVGTNVTLAASCDWEIKYANDVQVALVHAQVYAKMGYNTLTANIKALESGTAVDTKPFTALDRYLTIRYFEAIGATPKDYPSRYASFEAYALNAGESVWSNWTLMPGYVDVNNDHVADGWELYVMYGTNLTLETSLTTGNRGAVSPWGSISATRVEAPDHGGLSWRQEYDDGNYPTDPWNTHTFDFGDTAVTDAVAMQYDIKSAERQLADNDNDGLSNWAEYLASLKIGVDFDVDNPCSVLSNVYDYFVKTDAGQYVGESLDADGLSLIADHDFMEDDWEDLWDPADVFPYALYANKYVYDANLDGDEDGWKNWSECRAYHWGCGFYSDIIDTFNTGDIDSQVRCFPQPAIGLKVTYSGSKDPSWKSLIVRTWTANSTYPDAIFQVDSMKKASSGGVTYSGTNTTSTLGGMEKTQILGVYNGMKVIRGYLNPGLIVPSSAKFEMTPVSQELMYRWDCTECGGGSGLYAVYKQDITKHGEAKTDPNNKGVTLVETKPSQGWALFATSGGGSDGRHGEIYYCNENSEKAANVAFGEIDYRTGEFRLDLERITQMCGCAFEGMAFRTVISYNLGAYWPQTVWLSAPEKGYVKEGENTIEAFLDLDEDGRYDVGEPYGILRNVNIGWQKTPEMRIELTDGTYNGIPLFETEPGIVDNNDDEYDKEQSTIDSRQITDGKIHPIKIDVDKAKIQIVATNVVEEIGVDGGILARFELQPDGESKGRLRIVRLNVNGKTLKFNRTVFAKNVDVTYGKVFTLADFIWNGQIDLDAKYLVADATTAGIPQNQIRTVEYGVYWRDDTTPLYTFTRTFDDVETAPLLSRGYEDSYYKLLKDQPELTWVGGEGYAAFAVQVSEQPDFSTVLYAATNILPAAGADGITFKPDLYVGQELKDQTTYYWRVAQLNAKFTKNAWSEVASFATAVESKNADTGYGKLAAEIRYFGPATNALSDVVVGVYESGDFCCAPVARKRLAGSGTIASLTNAADRAFTTISTNIVLDGIAPGEYYVMAFVDTNTNGVHDAYETWGYLCKITTAEKDLWTPVTTNVVSVKKAPPKVLIVMEDTDVNQDMIPDCLQDMSDWALSEDRIDSDGDGLTDTEEDRSATERGSWDTDGDGMPDGWEEKFAGTSSIDPDGANCVPGDVMAYLELSYPILRVQSTETGAESWYVVTNNVKYFVGDNVAGKTLPLAYSYNMTDGFLATGTFGIGREVTIPSGDYRIVEIVENAKVALVHAQVYDYAGFSSRTCVSTADAVNTKPFTALDKYLVARYLEAIGLGDEKAMNAAGVKYTSETASASPWAKQTLSPTNADNNGNGVADGWELYVMFGEASTKAAGQYASADKTPINPWRHPDDARKLAPGTGSELTLVQEYDNGHVPTNPWRLDTDEDGVRDYYAYYYHLKGDDRVADNDGDGLSNMAEYMISELFQFAKLDPDNPKTDGCCVDYFRKVSDLYFGEIFMDHDQVADAWERLYPGYASDSDYDGLDDPDQDGWSNYAEARCGTNPNTDASVGLDNYELAEYPIPTIEMKVVYNGNQALINKPLVVKAWNQSKDPDMTGAPDANWTIGATSDNAASQTEGANTGAGKARVVSTVERSKYLGVKSSTTVTLNLGPGSVVPNSLQIKLRNPIYEAGSLVNGQFVFSSAGLSSSAKWYVCLEDDGLGVIRTVADQMNKRVAVGTVDYATGKTVVDFSQLTGTVVLAGSSGEEDNVNDESAPSYVRFDLSGAHVLLAWTTANSGSSTAGTYYLSDPDNNETSGGHVREGLTSFVVYVGDGTGKYVAGAPFGFVRDVDVGWQGAKFTIELSEMNAITPRILLWEDTCDRANVVDETVTMNLYDRLLAKDKAAATAFSNSYVVAGIKNDQAHLRIVRFGINDMFTYNLGAGVEGGLDPRIVLDRTFDKNGREYLHEGDFLQGGEYDLDWSYLNDEVILNAGVQSALPSGVTNVTYLVVLEGGKGFEYWVRNADPDEVDDPSTKVHRLATTIERRFELYRSTPVGEKVTGCVHGSRPTFTWSMPNEETWAKKYGSSYTAFNLKISDLSTGQVVWESGLQRAPAVVDGKFTWTAPVYFGDQTSKGKMLSATGNYSWQVSMYNAKWPYLLKSDGTEVRGTSKYSEAINFSAAVNNSAEMNDNGSSSIAVAVKYAGPVEVLAKVGDLAVTQGKVRVQAFERADFAGEPVAETVATEKIADTSIMTENARLIGLPGLETYYVCAYIDLNGNFRRDPWEPWGYAKDEVVLTTETVRAPLVGLYIEDTDLDDDWLPDAWEYAKAGWSGEWGAIKKLREASVNVDGTVLFSTNNFTHAESYAASFPSDTRGVTLEMFENGAFATTLLGGEAEDYNWTIQEISASIAKQVKIRENSVKVTGLSLDYDTGDVHIFVDADVAPSIAGEVVGRLYGLTDLVQCQKTVKVRVYSKTTLAQEGWTVLGEGIEATIGVDSAEVIVPTGLTSDDFKSGFFKVEIYE